MRAGVTPGGSTKLTVSPGSRGTTDIAIWVPSATGLMVEGRDRHRARGRAPGRRLERRTGTVERPHGIDRLGTGDVDRHPAGRRVGVQVESRLDRCNLPGRRRGVCRPAARARAGGAAARAYRPARRTPPRPPPPWPGAAASVSSHGRTSGRPAASSAISGGTIIAAGDREERGVDEHRRDDRQPAHDGHDEPQQVMRLRQPERPDDGEHEQGHDAHQRVAPRRDGRQQQARGEKRQHPEIGGRRREPERERGQRDPAGSATLQVSDGCRAGCARRGSHWPSRAMLQPTVTPITISSTNKRPGRAYQG